MSYSIDGKKLKQLVDYYSIHNNGEQRYCLNALMGEQGILRYLQTSAFQGIDSTSIEDRLIWFGSNEHINSTKPTPFYKILLSPMEHLAIKFYAMECVIILLLGFLTSYNSLKYPYLEGLASCFGFTFTYILLLIPQVFQYFDNQELTKYSKPLTRCQVWRDNQRIEIYNSDLVVGDIVELKEGSIIGADGIIIEGQLSVQEKVGYKEFLTFKAVNKRCISKMKKIKKTMKLLTEKKFNDPTPLSQKWSPIVIGGSKVVEGEGRMTVLCVGKYSREGTFTNSIHRSAVQRKSIQEQKVSDIFFSISKYMIIALIIKILLFITKFVVFIFLKYDKNTRLIPWKTEMVNLGNLITILLVGLPIYPIVGLAFGAAFIKWKMYKNDHLYLKYAKDCTKMKEVSTIGYKFLGKNLKINLLKWWNQSQQLIESENQSRQLTQINLRQFSDCDDENDGKKGQNDLKNNQMEKKKDKNDKMNSRFLKHMVQALRCQDISPLDIGLKHINTFYPFLGQRYIENINITLNNFANQKAQQLALISEQQDSINEVSSDEDEEEWKKSQKQQNISSGQLRMSEQDNSACNLYPFSLRRLQNTFYQHSQYSVDEEPRQIVYFKGSAETIVRESTHMMDRRNGKILPLKDKKRKKILGMIWRQISHQKNSIGLAYIEVNPHHPKFREPGYKIVFLGLIYYYQTHNQKEFEALSKIRNCGTNVVLITDEQNHQQSISIAKQFGIIMPNKPSIQLKGYDLKKISGGIICKTCKKSICCCENTQNNKPRLKNQDQFNRIQKHLHVVSEASPTDKLVFATGITNAHLINCMVGFKVDDIPALRSSHICIGIHNHICDQLTSAALEIIIPSDSLVNFHKLMDWGNFSANFFRKYLSFCLIPSIVGFVVSFITGLVSNQFVISVLHCTWVCLVICPLLGLTFAFTPNEGMRCEKKCEKKTKSEQQIGIQGQNYEQKPFLTKINTRYITSQVILQVLILMILIFFGHNFIPEKSDQVDETIIGDNWTAKYKNQDKKTVCSGLNEQLFSLGRSVYADTFEQYGIHSRHLTFVFNVYVLMQIFSYFNCRKVNQRSLNVFEGMKLPHIIILVIVFSLQALIVSKGGNIWGLYPYGLNFLQWILCMGFSLSVVVVGLLVKQLPDDEDRQENKGRKWLNRSYNLAVMSIVPRQTLIDFEIEQDYEMKKLRGIEQKK